MTVEEIKNSLAVLSPSKQNEVSAFLFHLRHKSDEEYQTRISTCLANSDPAHWLTPEEFERQLDQR